MKTFENYISTVGRLPKWSLVLIMVIPVYIFFGLMAYNKEPTKQVSVGHNEVAVVIDPDLTNCEERGIVSEVASGCVLNRMLTSGIHGIPESHHVEVYTLEVLNFEFRINSATIKAVDDE
jgi:hypothetical protein